MIIFFIFMQNLLFADGEFAKHDNEIVALVGKYTTAEKNIRELILEKNKTTDNKRIQEIVIEIKKNMADRADGIKRYNKDIHHLKFEHPERGKSFDRKYMHYDEKANKKFEDDINRQLSEVLSNVKSKYDIKE